MVVFFLTACTVGLSAEPRKSVLEFWESEWNQLAEKETDLNLENAYDPEAWFYSDDVDPVVVVARRTKALLRLLESSIPGSVHDGFSQELLELSGRVSTVSPGSSERRELYSNLCALRRKIMFSSPLLDFDSLLFVIRGVTSHYSLGHGNGKIHANHICDQYHGQHAKTGGGLFMLKNAFKGSPVLVDLASGAEVTGSINSGKRLGGGSFLSPELSHDGQTVYFAYVDTAWEGFNWVDKATRKAWLDSHEAFTRRSTYHIYRIGIDGSNPEQLTDGTWNEFDPCVLPDGRIAFISERRGGQGRCHGRPVPTYTLHVMNTDGSGIRPLSYHETNEWHPSVANDGKIVYSRWDYVDREATIAHHIWLCMPDGRDPRAPHGNYPKPYTTADSLPGDFNHKGKPISGKRLRPDAELNIRSIPGSRLFVATAAPHHGQAFGSLITIDPTLPDDDMLSQIRIITPEVEFPEARGPQGIGVYGTAYPLSEDMFLCAYKDDLVVLDRFGNRELIFSRKEAPSLENDSLLRCIDPIPVRATDMPPTIPSAVDYSTGARRAAIQVADVYESDLAWPEGTRIHWLRVVQLIPYPIGARQHIGYINRDLGRMNLGVVPVEEDGSVHFEAPVGKAIYFQALDQNKMAVQSMRSCTYVHPGEQLSCLGCHEDKWASSAPVSPSASAREPSIISPEIATEDEPFSFYKHVYPIMQNKCLPCHQENGKGPQAMKYGDLESWVFFHDACLTGKNNPHCGSRSIPGIVGARASRIGKALMTEAHRSRLSNDEIHAITLWIDLNAPEYSVYNSKGSQDRQKAGETVWPMLDVDPDDPYDRAGMPYLPSDAYPDLFSSTDSRPERLSVVRGRELAPKLWIRGSQMHITNTWSEPVTVRVYTVTGRNLTDPVVVNSESVSTIPLVRSVAHGVCIVGIRGKVHSLTIEAKFLTF